ncbi:hypothetical protein EDD21DRAFT_406362 [Dissophora ornata]|nr:hypothetical protein EDD21DRAFT_406362 [Dissophora ornata]
MQDGEASEFVDVDEGDEEELHSVEEEEEEALARRPRPQYRQTFFGPFHILPGRIQIEMDAKESQRTLLHAFRHRLHRSHLRRLGPPIQSPFPLFIRVIIGIVILLFLLLCI